MKRKEPFFMLSLRREIHKLISMGQPAPPAGRPPDAQCRISGWPYAGCFEVL